MTINVMKALRFAAYGSTSLLRIEQVPIPEPGEGEALVRVKAAAINPSDIANVAGCFKKATLPHQACEPQLSVRGAFCRKPLDTVNLLEISHYSGAGAPRATETQK